MAGAFIALTRLARCFSGFVLLIVSAWLGSPAAKAQAPPAVAQHSNDAANPGHERRKMISWVVLSNSYVDLTVDALRKKLDEVYPGQFLPPNNNNFVIDGPTSGQFLIKSNIPGAGGIFMLFSVPGPYTEFSKFAEAIADSAMLRSVKAQCCWLSVDLIQLHARTTEEVAYRFIEPVLAKLAPSDAAFLVDPEKGVTIPFSDDIRDRLAKGEEIRSSR
jgi:hypothetical protein